MSCCPKRPSRPKLRLLSRPVSHVVPPSSMARLAYSSSPTPAAILKPRMSRPSPSSSSQPSPQSQWQQQRLFHATPSWHSGIIAGFADTMRILMPKATKTYVHYAVSQRFAQACMAQADYTCDRKKVKKETIAVTETGEHIGEGSTVWHKTLNLLPTYSTWASITFLHAYLLNTRIRALDLPNEEIKTLMAGMIDTIFYDMEAAMDQKHRLTSSATRQKYLRQYFEVWRGSVISYDEGLVKGDAWLAAAVWRNVYKASEDVDVRNLAKMVAYMRAVLAEMDRMPDPEFMHGLAETAFGKGISGTLLTGPI